MLQGSVTFSVQAVALPLGHTATLYTYLCLLTLVCLFSYPAADDFETAYAQFRLGLALDPGNVCMCENFDALLCAFPAEAHGQSAQLVMAMYNADRAMAEAAELRRLNQVRVHVCVYR